MKTEWSTEPGPVVEFEHGHGKALGVPFCGTNEVIHISDSVVEEKFRGKGLGDIYHKERLEFLKEEGSFKYVTCIVNSENLAQIKIVENNGWKCLDSFKGYHGTLRLYGRVI